MTPSKNKKQQTIVNMFARMSDTNINKNNRKHNSIEPPVSFATFQRFIANLPEIISQYSVQNKKSTDEEPQSFEKDAKAYYYDFYTKPEIRKIYPFKLKPCPSSIRNKLLQSPEEDRGGGENQGIQEEASFENDQNHKMNQENVSTTDSNRISFDDYIFPVTYEEFKKHIANQRSLVKNVIKDLYKPKTTKDFKLLYTDKKCYKNALKLCYKEFYTNSEWRNRYKCEFDDAPQELLTKLLSYGSARGSKTDDHQVNNIISHTDCDNNKGLSSADVPSTDEVDKQKIIERLKRRIPSSYDALVDQSILELPFTLDNFYEKIRNSKRIRKELLQFISKDDRSLYLALRSNDEICEHILCEYYLLFYVFPLVRGIFEIQLKPCPTAVKELLESVPNITKFLKIDFPVQLKDFKKYSNYEEILNQIIPIFGCEDQKIRQKLRSDKMICKRLFEEFFVSYYLAPIITRELIKCKFENVPMDLRTKLLGNSTDEQQQSTLIEKDKDDDEHEHHEQQQNIAHTSVLNMKDFTFPVSFETFRKYIDYEEVMDSLIKPLAHGDKKRYETLRRDEIFCQSRFNTYYYWFYREPKIRSVYKFNFDKAPKSLMEKLLGLATRKSQENITKPVEEQQDDENTTTTAIQDDETTTITAIQDDETTTSEVQEKEPQESIDKSRSPTPSELSTSLSNQIFEEDKNHEQSIEIQSSEANTTLSDIEVLEDQQAPPFLTLHATYQADPEDDIEQYEVLSIDYDDEANITPDELEPENTDDVATIPYASEEVTSNYSEDLNQNQVNLEEDDVAMELFILSKNKNSMSVEELPLEENIQLSPSSPTLEEVHALLAIEDELTMSNQVQRGDNSHEEDDLNITVHSNDTDSMAIEETPPEELIQQLAQAQNDVEMTMHNQDQEANKNQDHNIITHSNGTKTTPIEKQSLEEIFQQLPPKETMEQNDSEHIPTNPIEEAEKNQYRCVDVHSIIVNKSLNLPVSLNTFKSLIVNIDDLVSRLAEEFSRGHGPMFLARVMRFNFELELYRLFYILPEIRNFYEFRIRPCPSRAKEALLQTPNSFQHKDYKLPVTIDVFREFINYNEILDQVIRTYVTTDDMGDYEQARNDVLLCNRMFQSFYYAFYLTPIIIRGTFLYNFHNASVDSKMKLHQFAILINKDVVVDGGGGNPSKCDSQTTTTTTLPVNNCEIANVNNENLVEMAGIHCVAAATSSSNLMQQNEMPPVNCETVNGGETIEQNLNDTNKETHKDIEHLPHPKDVEVMPNTKPNEQISLNAKDWILPVTLNTFKQYINYEEVMDKHLKSIVKGNEKQLEKIRNNKKLCAAQFRRIYYTFYIKPELRKQIKYNFDAAPNDLKDKLLSFALPNIQTTTETTEEKEFDVNKLKKTDEIPNVQRTEALISTKFNEVCTENKENDAVMPTSADDIPREQSTKALRPIKSNKLTKEACTVNNENESVVSTSLNEITKVLSNEVLIPPKVNKPTKEVCQLNKYNEFGVPKQIVEVPKQRVEVPKQTVEMPKETVEMPKQTVDEFPKLQRTETLTPELNKMTIQVRTVNKINESVMPNRSNQIPIEQRTETLQTPESKELTKELLAMIKGKESNAETIQRTESNDLTRKLCPVSKVIASDVAENSNEILKEQEQRSEAQSTITNDLIKEVISIINRDCKYDVVSKVTENETTNKDTKENMNMDIDLDTKPSKKTRRPLSSQNINFPVPLNIFEKFVNQTEILDKIVKQYAQQHKKDYQTLRNDEKFCQNEFKKFYNTFYIKPNLRKFYNVKFNNAPTDLLKKLWSSATTKETRKQSIPQQQSQVQIQQKTSTKSTSSIATTTTTSTTNQYEKINRVVDRLQPTTDVILFQPNNLNEYIKQRISDPNIRELIREQLINNKQKQDNNNDDDDEVMQQQKPVEDSIEVAEKLFFQNVSRLHKTKYLICSSFELKQEIWIAVTTLNIHEFFQFTGIYGSNDLYIYNKSYLLRRFYRYTIEEGNWPVNLYIKMMEFVNLMQLKCVQLNDFNLELISPKLFYWHELMIYTNFDDCVRYDYYKRYRKQIPNESNMHEIRKEYYNRCWCHDQWISQIPRITNQEIIKQINEIDWSNISQGKKRSQNEINTQNDHQNQGTSNVPFRRSQNIFTDSSQSTTTTSQPTPSKSNQMSSGSQQNKQNQRSNVSFGRSQTVFSDSSQSLTTPKRKHNQMFTSNIFKRSQNVFTDSSQSTTQPTPTKSNQICETQLIQKKSSQKNLPKLYVRTHIGTTQLVPESPRKKLEKTLPGTYITKRHRQRQRQHFLRKKFQKIMPRTQISETQMMPESSQKILNKTLPGTHISEKELMPESSQKMMNKTLSETHLSERQLLENFPRKKLQKVLPRSQISTIQLMQDSPQKMSEKSLPGTLMSLTQLLQDSPPTSILERALTRSQIPETQLLESQNNIDKATTSQANASYFDHNYGIHGSTIPPVGIRRDCTQNFVDVDNVIFTQSQGLGNNLSLANEHDPLMSASLNVQEIPIAKEIKMEKLSPLNDILFLLDSEGSNYTCEPLPENIIEIVDNEMTFDNDLRFMLSSGDSNESTFPRLKQLQEGTISELNNAILTEEIMQMSSTEKIIPDEDISISDSVVAPLIATTSTNLQETANLNQALCCSSEEIVVTSDAIEENAQTLKHPSSSSSSCTSTKTIKARQISKDRRPPDNNKKTKRQKTQHHDPIGQLRHEYRALPLGPIQSAATEIEVTQQLNSQVSSAINTESGDKQLTISQAFTVDNTLFNSTELQNVLAQHTFQLTSDREKMLKQNSVPPFVTIRKKVINSNPIIEDNLIIQKPITTTSNPTLIQEPLITTNIHIYRHLIQFHYVDSLNESDIVKYGLLSHGLGQPYQQAVINIDGKSKCKVYGSLVPSLFSNCPESLHKDFQFVLNDLKKFHYNCFDKKNINQHEDDYDIRKRVLKCFIKSASIFSNFLLEHQTERFKSGRCLPFERTTLERHSKLQNNCKGDNPFTIAIKPHILERMAQLNSQYNNKI